MGGAGKRFSIPALTPAAGSGAARPILFPLPLLLALVTPPAAAQQVVDRVVAAIGFDAITESRLVQETRLSALFNRQEPDLSPEGRRETLERLIDQKLMAREMELLRMTEVSPTDSQRFFEGMIKAHYESEQEFWQAARSAGVRESAVRERVKFFAALARFVQIRFIGAVTVSEEEIENVYQQKVAAPARAAGREAPKLDDVRAAIESALAQKKGDEALEEWLRDARDRANINVFWNEKP